MTVLKELIFTVSILARCGDFEGTDFLTVSILGGCGGLESSDFKQLLLWEHVMVFKEFIFYNF